MSADALIVIPFATVVNVSNDSVAIGMLLSGEILAFFKSDMENRLTVLYHFSCILMSQYDEKVVVTVFSSSLSYPLVAFFRHDMEPSVFVMYIFLTKQVVVMEMVYFLKFLF